jgi:16S rRNA pseudouridine516 synthase
MEMDVTMKIRLDKYLADMQTGTRSQVKEYIRKGRVAINNVTVKSSDIKIDTETDTVSFDGQPVGYVEYEYYMLNKPAGVITATNDKSSTTVTDLISSKRKDLFPVGRLDKDTEGLLLITNDGALAHRLLAPKSHVDKTYYAVVRGEISPETVALFENGLHVDNELTALPAHLEVLSFDELKKESEILITLHEGKFHQVKRMFEAVNSQVHYLKRIKFANLTLDDTLPVGTYRPLTNEEINNLKA